MFEPQSENELLRLALERAVGVQKDILGKLLRDGRTALHHIAGAHIDDQGAGDGNRIDAEMVIKIAVLDSENRHRHMGWQCRQANRRAGA